MLTQHSRGKVNVIVLTSFVEHIESQAKEKRNEVCFLHTKCNTKIEIRFGSVPFRKG